MAPDQLRAPAADLVAVLEELLPRLGVGGPCERLRTAEAGVELLEALRRAGNPTIW